jgi:TrmH family RNA methyltransferase
VRAAVDAGAAVEIYTTLDHEVGRWLQDREVRVTTAEQRVIEAICDTRSSQGVVAVCRLPEPDLPALLSRPGPVVLVERLSDPGNLGTIIRTAEAVGAAGVITTPGSVDPWNPKTVRAAAGSSFRLPVVADQDGLAVLELLAKGERTSVALTAEATREARQLIGEWLGSGAQADSIAWIVGSEAHGISNELAQTADLRARLPMRAPVESLNAAIALSVCLYAAAWVQVPK